MKIGLQMPNFTWPGGPSQMADKLAQIARVADDAGGRDIIPAMAGF